MQIMNCEASVWYIQSDKLSIWSIGLPPPLLMINSSILKRMLRFFYFSVWIYKMIILHWKGDNYACFNYKTFLHHVSPFVLCKEKVIISFWSYFINEWMLFLWMVSVWNRLCIFYFFFLCEVEARLRTPSMIYSRFLWLLLLLFWAFLAPMQSGYLYKAPSFCIYKKKKH